jgi:hypothetical protein
MENIKRMVMLLKPVGSAAVPVGGGGTLKLQSFKEGVSVYFRSDGIKEGSYGLYLFLAGGKELKESYAGEIKGREFYSTLYGVSIDNIKGAAVINADSSGAYNFLLKSTGPDWTKIIERFRIAKQGSHMPPRDNTVTAANTTENAPEAAEAIDSAACAHIVDNANTVITGDTIDDSVVYDFGSGEKNIADEEIKVEELPYFEQTAEKKEEGFEENGCEECPNIQNQEKTNPFPNIFPNSEWIKISYPGPLGWWHYISGKIFRGSEIAAMVLGVPGEYCIAPPAWLEGFGTYLRSVEGDAKGYWLMFQDAETGEVLDMDLSRHDA